MKLSLKKKSAFTLIEILVVITIIAVLVAIISFDFAFARQRQQLSLLADQALALMQQAHSEVVAGKVAIEKSEDLEEEEEERVLLCEGAYFEVGTVPMWGSVQFDLDTEDCLIDDVELVEYGFTPGEAYIESITVGGAEVEAIHALFVPPDGDIFFYNGEDYVGDAVIHFAHPDNDEIGIDLTIEYLTNQAFLTVITGEDEEE